MTIDVDPGDAAMASPFDGEEAQNGIDGKSLAAGGAVLGVAVVVANAGNYLLNVFLGRWLTPAEFADANLMVTIMLLVTAIAISLQLIAARFAGIHAVTNSDKRTLSMAGWLERRAMLLGAAVGATLAFGAGVWSDFFNSASAWPFVILGIGMPFYLVQAVGRGVLQGQLTFRRLAVTFVVEMAVRLAVGVTLVAFGFGVEGATIGLTLSFITSWLHVRILTGRLRGEPMGAEAVRELLTFAGPVAVLLLGQIVINNGDVLIAKRFLEPDTAGVYAAVALVGRAVFFLSWSVATTLFPAAAQRDELGEESNGLLYSGLGIVALMGLCFVVGAGLLGGTVLGQVFGPEYSEVSGPLAWYALATSLFAMANLIVTHHLSMGRMREALVLLAGGVVQTTLLMWGRGSIDSLIEAQVIAMTILLVAVAASHCYGLVVDRSKKTTNATLNQLTNIDPGKGAIMTDSKIDAYRAWATTPLDCRPEYSVVIPAYNEEWRIVPTIGAIATHMSSLGRPWELIVADDGSTDSTVELVKGLNLVNLHLLVAERNGGKGSAVRRGMLAADGEVILFADADQSTPIEQFETLLQKIHDGNDIVVGSRAVDGAVVANKSLGRKVFSLGLNLLVRGLFRIPVSDTQCGFKMFTAESADRLFRRVLVDDFSFDLEILYLARKFDMKIAEVPVTWIDAPGSKVDAVEVALGFLRDFVTIRGNDYKGRYAVDNNVRSRQVVTYGGAEAGASDTPTVAVESLASEPLKTAAGRRKVRDQMPAR